MARRIACLRIAELPLVAALRACPELADRPLAVTSTPGVRAEILAVSPEAKRRGVRPFTSAVRARAVCAELCLRVASPALERATREALLDVAHSVSPRIEPAPAAAGLYAAEAAVHLDVSGSAALFQSETGLASALVTRASRVGLPAAVAIAGSRSTARIAARTLDAGAENDTLVIPAGEEATFLAPLPLELLDPDDALAESLDRFGIRRVGDLLRIPQRALSTRLGAGLAPLLARARGEERAPIPAVRDDARCEEAIDLELPVDRLEPLAFVLRGLLARLAERLQCRGLGCGDLDLVLTLEGGGRDARRVGVAAPTRDVRVLLRLVALSLETLPPPAPVDQVSIACLGRPVHADQLDFFRPSGPPPARLARTLAELEALCGPGRVGAPAAPDTHRPHAFALAPFTPPGPGAAPRGEAGHPTPRLGLRALRPPVAARVRLVGGRPVQLQSALANGRVVSAAGPWRSTGAWWSAEERFAFDHFDVATSDGLVVRLRLDCIRNLWEIDAVYD